MQENNSVITIMVNLCSTMRKNVDSDADRQVKNWINQNNTLQHPESEIPEVLIQLEPLSSSSHQLGQDEDIQIVTGDGEYLKCSSRVLKEHSLYFEGLLRFEAQCWEKMSNLSQFDPAVVRAFVDLTHGKPVELPLDDCLDLAHLAGFLSSDSLLTAVDYGVAGVLWDHQRREQGIDVAALYVEARRWPHGGRLTATAKAAERAHFEVVRGTEEFLTLTEAELVAIIKSSDLVAAEAVVLRAITDWVVANG